MNRLMTVLCLLTVTLMITGCQTQSEKGDVVHPNKRISTAPATSVNTNQIVLSPPNSDVLLVPKETQWSWPLRGNHGMVFVEGTKGIDFTVSDNEAVYAVANGTVSFVGDSMTSYGHLLVIKHDNNYLSVYANNQKILVQEGQKVVEGQKVATTCGPVYGKWHFELRYQGKPVDPSLVIK